MNARIPDTADWFAKALNDVSLAHFGASCGYIGQGGTLPLMHMRSQGFPVAQVLHRMP